MRYENALIYSEDFHFHRGGFSVENGRFANVLSETDETPCMNLHGALVLPGFIDMHCHGAAGFDFSDSSALQLVQIAKHWARCGVTAFVATAMTQAEDKLKRSLSEAALYVAQEHAFSSALLGIRLEGPFVSPTRKGAQNGEYLRLPSIELFDEFYAASGGLLRVIDLAPELPGALELIRHASKRCIVSMGHTAADYEQAKAAIDAGASHVTHICNAMKPMHHREPGLIPAAFETAGLSAELIGDGKHVHPAMIRLLFSLFGAERMCLISDALSCCGAESKACVSGGQTVYVRDGLALLKNGTIAGSALDLFELFKRVITFGINTETAIRAVSFNPARVLGVQSEIGSIANGKRADFLICNDDFTLNNVFISGKEIPRE